MMYLIFIVKTIYLSILIVFVMFESSKEVVILSEGLIRSILRHVKSAIFKFLSPKSDRLLFVIG